MHFILALIALFFILVAIGIMVFLHYLRRGVKFVKKAMSGEMSDEDFERLSKKHYRKSQTNTFDKDYFKSTGQSKEQKQNQQQQGAHTQRTTTTAGGVTIIDGREPRKAQRKIFSKDEGEYVDYTEEA